MELIVLLIILAFYFRHIITPIKRETAKSIKVEIGSQEVQNRKEWAKVKKQLEDPEIKDVDIDKEFDELFK